MNWNDIEDYVHDNREEMDRPFDHKNQVWDKIQAELKSTGTDARIVWWKPLSGIAAAVLLGLLSVWGLQEYRELTSLSPEMLSSVQYYENIELRLARSMEEQSSEISPDIRQDLKEIEHTQLILKEALRQSTAEKKGWIYNALIETYELKIQILEEIINMGQLKDHKSKPDGTSL